MLALYNELLFCETVLLGLFLAVFFDSGGGLSVETAPHDSERFYLTILKALRLWKYIYTLYIILHLLTLYYKVRRDSFLFCFIFPARAIYKELLLFAPRYSKA